MDAVDDGESPGTAGWPRGALNRRLELALAAATPASIPAMGCEGDCGAALEWSTGRGEGEAVLRMQRGSPYL